MNIAKEIWVVIDEAGSPDFAAPYPDACHEHINEAIADGDVEGAAEWIVRRYVLADAATAHETSVAPYVERLCKRCGREWCICPSESE